MRPRTSAVRFAGLLFAAPFAATLATSSAAAPPLRSDSESATSPAFQLPWSGERDTSHWNLDKKKLALSGHDPVAYFPEGGGKALKGDERFTHTHKGVVHRFASDANKALFVKTPDKFEPQYGGWCAYAMAFGEKVEIDPKSFKITEGKLYVFYKSFFNDTRAKWTKDEAVLAKKADANWNAILEKPAPNAAQTRS